MTKRKMKKIYVVMAIVFIIFTVAVGAYNLKIDTGVEIDDEAYQRYANKTENMEESVKEIVKNAIESEYKQELRDEAEELCFEAIGMGIEQQKQLIDAIQKIKEGRYV